MIEHFIIIMMIGAQVLQIIVAAVSDYISNFIIYHQFYSKFDDLLILHAPLCLQSYSTNIIYNYSV